MSFRKYGGTQFASSHNIVKSNVNTTDSFYVTKNVRDSNNRGAKAFSWLTTALLVMYILAAIFYMIYSNTSRDVDVFMTIFFIISGCLIFKDMIEVSYQS